MSQMNQPVMPNDLPNEPASWPKVIGIISIVWGSIGLLCGICGIGGLLFSGAIVNIVPPEQQEQMRAQMAAQQSPIMFVHYGIGFLLAILLLIAGIQTLRREPLGRTLHLAYGVLGTLSALFGAFLGWGVIHAQGAQLVGNAQQQQMQQMGSYFGLAFGVCFGLAYPVFCLIWFGVVKRDSRDLQGSAIRETMI
jgi:hypothetical protein